MAATVVVSATCSHTVCGGKGDRRGGVDAACVKGLVDRDVSYHVYIHEAKADGTSRENRVKCTVNVPNVTFGITVSADSVLGTVIACIKESVDADGSRCAACNEGHGVGVTWESQGWIWLVVAAVYLG